MHKITLADITLAMGTEMLLAASISSKTKKKKRLVFNPVDLKYRVTHEDEFSKTSSSYLNPQDAIDKYNDIYV